LAGSIYVSWPGDPGEPGGSCVRILFVDQLVHFFTAFFAVQKKDEAVRPRPLLISIPRIYKSPSPFFSQQRLFALPLSKTFPIITISPG
jgi:hypothetical protein